MNAVVVLVGRVRALLGTAGVAWLMGLDFGAVTRLVLVLGTAVVLGAEATVEVLRVQRRRVRRVTVIPGQRVASPTDATASSRSGGVR